MRRIAVAAFALGTLVAASSATAQATSSAASGMQFGISGGLVQPVGDFGDAAKTGFTIAGHLGFNPAALPFGLRADVSLSQFGLDDEFGDFLEIDDADHRVIGGALNAIFKLPGAAASPYLLAGPGIYNGKLTCDGCPDGSTKFALQGGGGVQFNLSGMTTNLEAKYVNVFTEGSSTSFIPVTFGINFGGGLESASRSR
ncbi:MAG: porin family protein [Gemmatimonadota bacterium]|nr:porin family protein [Gemmatimonadota bacterium]